MGHPLTGGYGSYIAKQMICKIPNPYAIDHQLPFISVPPHLLKTIRNSWYNKNKPFLYQKYSILSVMAMRILGDIWRNSAFKILIQRKV